MVPLPCHLGIVERDHAFKALLGDERSDAVHSGFATEESLSYLDLAHACTECQHCGRRELPLSTIKSVEDVFENIEVLLDFVDDGWSPLQFIPELVEFHAAHQEASSNVGNTKHFPMYRLVSA